MFKPFTASVLAAACIAASSSAMAGDWFAGAAIGTVKQDISVTEDGEKATYPSDRGVAGKLDDPGFGALRLGQYLNENVRVYATLGTGSVESSERGSVTINNNGSTAVLNYKETYSAENRELSFSADYVDNLFSMQTTKYFVGGTLGMNQMEAEFKGAYQVSNVAQSEKGSKKDNALMYGVQLGLIQELGEHFSAELGYRYTKMNNAVKFNVDGDQHKFKLKDQKLTYLAINYHF